METSSYTNENNGSDEPKTHITVDNIRNKCIEAGNRYNMIQLTILQQEVIGTEKYHEFVELVTSFVELSSSTESFETRLAMYNEYNRQINLILELFYTSEKTVNSQLNENWNHC